MYFTIILLLNLLLLLATWSLVHSGGLLSCRQKRSYILVILMTALISLDEYLTLAVDGVPGLRWFSIIFNFIGFALSPVLPLAVIRCLGSRRQSYPLSWVLVIINILCLLSGRFFNVDAANNYSRGSLFYIYPVTYTVTVLDLMAHSVHFSIRHQRHNEMSLFFVGAFLIVACTIQLILPGIHLAWLSVSISLILHYIYFSSCLQQTDSMTQLLNRRAFDNILDSKRCRAEAVIIMDINGFKKFNDSYGHPAGDECLSFFGQSILKVYGRCGACYRIGGDEFCVLLKKSCTGSIDALEARLRGVLKGSKHFRGSLSFAAGSSLISECGEIHAAVRQADRNMYRNKSLHEGSCILPQQET